MLTNRYDAVFQILVGSWTSPDQHDFYANGNVLAWSQVLPYKNEFGELPDNFGIDWASGVYGGSAVAHPIGAWQIYQHSGNATFLAQAYEFYKELFWDGIRNKMWGYAYDACLCLNKMAEVLGYPEDPTHWNTTFDMDNIQHFLENEWERDTPNMFGQTKEGVKWGAFAYTAMSMFPREWVEAMADSWLDNPEDGFLSEVPLVCIAKQDLPEQIGSNVNFAITPGANWYMLRGLYIHNIDALANKLTLGHLKKYHMEWGIPVAPESRRLDNSPHGDQYSNINAGKILLILEGMGGLRYSTRDDSFTFADNLPLDWAFMEFRVPVLDKGSKSVTWVKARAERQQKEGVVVKTVTVEKNPFGKLFLQPWLENREAEASEDFLVESKSCQVGHKCWTLDRASNASLVLHFNN